MRRQAGFTLLELLTVVAVVGILSAVTVPAMKSFSGSAGLRATAKQIAGDLWFARQKAIATSVPHSVEFDVQQNRYLVFKDDGGGEPANEGNGTIDTGEDVIRTRNLGGKYTFSEVNLDPDNSVIFVPKGTLKNGTAGGYVTITDGENQLRTVLIMASGLSRMD